MAGSGQTLAFGLIVREVERYLPVMLHHFTLTRTASLFKHPVNIE